MTVLYCLPSKQAEAAWRKGNQGYVAMVMLSSASLRRQKSETTRISTAPSVSLVGVLVNHLMRATGQQKLWKSVGWWNTVLWIGLHFISKDTKACVCVCVCENVCLTKGKPSCLNSKVLVLQDVYIHPTRCLTWKKRIRQKQTKKSINARTQWQEMSLSQL